MIFSFLPRWLVNELIIKYEKLDIYLIKDENYFREKNILLEKKIIKLNDFKLFIDRTKKSEYTNFIKIKFNFIKFLANNYKNEFFYDIKFKKYLYIKFNCFNMNVIKEIDKTLKEHKQYNKLIIDLRNNGGGNFESCLELLNKFLPPIQYLRLSNKNKTILFHSDNNFYKYKRIYILLGNKSASCSEIFSMVLKKKLNNVILLGTKTVEKECTQHTITNKKYKYIFSISDGIWDIDNETVTNLKTYIKNDSFKNIDYTSEDAYLRTVLKLDDNG